MLLVVAFSPAFVLHGRMLVSLVRSKTQNGNRGPVRPFRASGFVLPSEAAAKNLGMGIQYDSLALLVMVTLEYVLYSIALLAGQAAATHYDFDSIKWWRIHYWITNSALILVAWTGDILFLWPPIYRWMAECGVQMAWAQTTSYPVQQACEDTELCMMDTVPFDRTPSSLGTPRTLSFVGLPARTGQLEDDWMEAVCRRMLGPEGRPV